MSRSLHHGVHHDKHKQETPEAGQALTDTELGVDKLTYPIEAGESRRQAGCECDELREVRYEAPAGSVYDDDHCAHDQQRVNQTEMHRQTSIGTVASVRHQLRERLRAARLYAITPEAELDQMERVVHAWLQGGAGVVQLRHKRLARGRLLELARVLAAACARSGALFIVNDHLDVALLSGAHGVHLGPDDLSVAAARRVAGPDLLVGASASTPEDARQAERDGADYLGSGPAYTTPIKVEKTAIGPVGVAAVSAAVTIPVFAIGGIERSRLAELRTAGVERVCSIRALGHAADPEAEVQAWLRELNR